MSKMNGFKSGLLRLAGLIAGCTKSVIYNQTKPYLSVVGGFPASGDPASNKRLKPFILMFSDISPSAVHDNIDKVYASNLFFNDTFRTFKTRDEIKRYFLSFARTAVVTLTFLQFFEQGNDVWLQWKMRLQFKLGRKELDITSVGISHLRFNGEGAIVLHQDFWDGANGFYAHLPMIGNAIRAIQEKMADVEEE